MVLTESLNLAIDLASKGDFRASIESLTGYWPGVGSEPARDDVGDLDYARLLMVCGMLTIELADNSSTPEASAKDLLSKAVRHFGNDPGESEARYWLARAYLRCGENNEALLLADALLSEQTAEIEVVINVSAVKGLALLGQGDFAGAERAFGPVETLLPAASPLSQGRCLLSRGVMRRQIGKLDAALADHALAVDAFRNAGSARYEAAARNNIAVVFTQQGRYAEAREMAQSALTVFEQIGDRAYQAKALDQLARIYEREQNYFDMERCAARAVELLSDGDRASWLVEALTTHGTALTNLSLERAQKSITDALAIAQRLVGSKRDDIEQSAVTTAWKIVKESNAALDDLEEMMRPFERQAYESALGKHNGRITPAARELGLHHQAFQHRLETRFPEVLKLRRQKWKRHKSLFNK